MAKDEATGQYLNTLLRVVGALVSGDPIEIEGYGNVEVTRIMRDNWPGAPIQISFVTADGGVTTPLDEIVVEHDHEKVLAMRREQNIARSMEIIAMPREMDTKYVDGD